MKKLTSSRMLVALATVLALFLGGFAPVLEAAQPQSANESIIIKSPVEAQVSPQPRLAQNEQFDGQKLYKAAFELIRDMHKDLADTAARDKWSKEWENKFAGTKQLDTEAGTDEAIAQMLASLGQRFDYFMDVEATKAEKESVQSTLVGIGVTIKLRDVETILKSLPKGATRAQAEQAMKVGPGHELLVEEPIEGGPAAQVLKPGDVITKVDGKPIAGELQKDVISRIKGAENTNVDITIERTVDGKTAEHTFTITRKTVVVKVVKTKDLGDGVTYIKLSNFMSQNTVAEMRAALTAAAKGKGVIIDLRGNGGGSLSAVLTISAYLIPEGTILVTQSREENLLSEHEVIAQRNFILKIDPDQSDPNNKSISLGQRPNLLIPEDMPVVVLVDGGSASASEILSGVVQVRKRGLIVGKTTLGKGVGQTVVDLPFGRRLHITSFEFLPGGKKVDWIGVIPDVEVEQAADFGKTDNQLDEATKRIKQQIADRDARSQKAKDLEKQNRDEFQKALDQRQKKSNP